MSSDDRKDADELLKNADLALHRAKAEGGGTYRFFEAVMDADMQARCKLQLDLRKALSNGEFELYYQPVVNLERNQICGLEALLRWHHPERGRISPAMFIPVAEETGLILPIGEWALRQACTDAAKWPDHIKVAVNLSPVQFKSRNLVQMVFAALAASGLSASRLWSSRSPSRSCCTTMPPPSRRCISCGRSACASPWTISARAIRA